MVRFALLFGCLALGVTPHATAQVEPLRFLASTGWSMPYAEIQADRITGGIVFDLAAAIGESMKLPVSFLVMPRNRMDAAVVAGEVDVRCYVNPLWTKIPDAHVWTRPLFDAHDVIVGRTSSRQISSVAQIPPATPIGMVLGYVYPDLDDRVTSGALARDNAIDQEKTLLKLSVGRFPYAVANGRVVDWFKRQNPEADIAKWQLQLGKTEFYCGVVKTARIEPQRIVAAIERLKSSGRMDRILAAYQ